MMGCAVKGQVANCEGVLTLVARVSALLVNDGCHPLVKPSVTRTIRGACHLQYRSAPSSLPYDVEKREWK